MVVPLVRAGWILGGLAIYEGAAAALGGVLISHVRGLWRLLVVTVFGVLVAHVVLEWAHDDIRRLREIF